VRKFSIVLLSALLVLASFSCQKEQTIKVLCYNANTGQKLPMGEEFFVSLNTSWDPNTSSGQFYSTDKDGSFVFQTDLKRWSSQISIRPPALTKNKEWTINFEDTNFYSESLPNEIHLTYLRWEQCILESIPNPDYDNYQITYYIYNEHLGFIDSVFTYRDIVYHSTMYVTTLLPEGKINIDVKCTVNGTPQIIPSITFDNNPDNDQIEGVSIAF
jgi:hypothetical protein